MISGPFEMVTVVAVLAESLPSLGHRVRRADPPNRRSRATHRPEVGRYQPLALLLARAIAAAI